MAKFPLEYNDQDSQAAVDAINYVLSGPSGLGQNFAGISGYNTVYLTGNYQSPFTSNSVSINSLGGNGTTSLTVDTTSGIDVGNYVFGPGIGTGAQVTNINATTKIVTLSVANTNSVSGLITFSPVQTAELYVAPITITSIIWLSPFAIKINFTAQPNPPFALGNNVTVSGATPTIYNQTYNGAGVVECGTNYAIVRHNNYIANPGSGSGGTVSYSNTLQPPSGSALPPPNNWTSTDCIGNGTVSSPTDRVFISGQLDQLITYTATATSDLRISVAINRYKITTNTNVGNIAAPTIVYVFDETVAERNYIRTGLTAGGPVALPSNIETIFATFIDQPPIGYYQYRLEVLFRVTNPTGALQVNESKVDVRTLALQVVKQ